MESENYCKINIPDNNIMLIGKDKYLSLDKDAQVLAELKEWLLEEIKDWQSGSGAFHLGDPIRIDGIRESLNKIKELQNAVN